MRLTGPLNVMTFARSVTPMGVSSNSKIRSAAAELCWMARCNLLSFLTGWYIRSIATKKVINSSKGILVNNA
jgi:hypothetical protein